ncbi:MAG: hypothetical protein ACREPL_08800 [Rhodanobacteraceae bacterium]
MKPLSLCVAAALGVAAVASAYAADSNKTVVTVDYTDTVAPPEAQAYVAGVKAYNQCLREHGVKFSEYAVNRETGGNTYVFSYDAGPYTWADHDALIAASKPCDATFRAQVNPHLKSESGAFYVMQPDMSHMPDDSGNQTPPPLYHIVNFTLNPGRAADEAFTNAVKKITAAAAKTHWTWYYETDAVEGGGDGAPDYVLVIGLKNYAQHGLQANPPLWTMMASVYGQANADAIHTALDGAVKSSSDHFDRYNADLSYIAGK